MEPSKINRILSYTFFALLFVLLLVVIIKLVGREGEDSREREIKFYSLPTVPGPPYPLEEVYGFLPQGKVLIGEMKRRGVPAKFGFLWSKLVRDSGIYNVVGDWFMAKWDITGTPLYFEYMRRGRFLLRWIKGVVSKDECGEASRKIKAEGKVGYEGLYWSMRHDVPAYVVAQVWRAMRGAHNTEDLLKARRWRMVYSQKGECPGDLLFLQITYGEGVTSTFLRYPYGGVTFWNEDGENYDNCGIPPVSMSDLIYYEHSTGLLGEGGFIFAPFTGKITSLNPLTLSSEEGRRMSCFAKGSHPEYVGVDARISRGSVLLTGVNRFKCVCNSPQKRVLPPSQKKKLQALYLRYVSIF